MPIEQIKLECLRIAAQLCRDGDNALELARRLYLFICERTS